MVLTWCRQKVYYRMTRWRMPARDMVLVLSPGETVLVWWFPLEQRRQGDHPQIRRSSTCFDLRENSFLKNDGEHTSIYHYLPLGGAVNRPWPFCYSHCQAFAIFKYMPFSRDPDVLSQTLLHFSLQYPFTFQRAQVIYQGQQLWLICSVFSQNYINAQAQEQRRD